MSGNQNQWGVLPQNKMTWVNNNFGNQGIAAMQGTTRILYDTLAIDGRTEFRFFETSNSRDFPFTNVGGQGATLLPGESMILERAYLSVLNIDTTGARPDIVTVDPVDPVTFPNIVGGELSLQISNSRTIKRISVQSFFPQYNKNADYDDYNVFTFDTLLAMPPLQEFVASLVVPQQAAIVDTYLRLTIEGAGAILSPKTNY